MYSGFKTKAVPYLQVQNHCRQLLDIDFDESYIPDQHSTANSHHYKKPPTRPNPNLTSKHAQQKQANLCTKNMNQNSNSKNPVNADIKKLTHGMRSYKDIKSSYTMSRTQESSENQYNSRSGSKKKYTKLDGQLFNKINIDQNQCTFTPKTNGGQSYKNFKDFVNFQDNFLAKKLEKIQKIKKQKGERQSFEATFVPTIDKKSRKISESSSDYQIDTNGSIQKLEKAPIYERLYKIPQKRDKIDEEATFTPKILNKSKSMIRGDKVENLLYSDAQRRIQHQKMMQKQSNIPKYPPTGLTSSNQKHTNKLICKKLRSQFLQFIQDDQEEGVMKSVSPILAVTVISEIFNVELNPNKNQQLCWLIVSLLIGDQQKSSSNGEIQTRRLWDFIRFVVVGAEGFQKGTSSFSEEDAKKIHKELGYFYSMRLSKTYSKPDEEDTQTYRIQTSAKTNKMAEAHRARKLEQITQFISDTNIGQPGSLLGSKSMKSLEKDNEDRVIRLEDLFILDQIRKKTELEQVRMKKQEQEMKQCTFKPALNELSLKKAKEKVKSNEVKPNPQVSSFEQKSKEEVHKEKNKKIVIKSKNNENRPSSNVENKATKDQISTCRNIKNVDKTLLRLSLARKVKDAVILSKQRGYNCNGSANWLREVQGQKKQILTQVSNFLGYRQNSKEKQIQSQRQCRE